MTRSCTSPYTYSRSFFSFKDTSVRACIHAIKYYHRKDLVAPLVAYTIDDIQDHIAPATFPILVPIPMTALRRWSRGYNQASHIAVLYAKALSIPVYQDLLLRKKTSKHQVATMSRVERLHAQRDTFFVQTTQDLSNITIILIDDVTTTGATLHEARHTLIQAGAHNVIAYTLAH